MSIFRLVIGIVFVGLMALAMRVVSGQDYPTKPIRIVTAAAGGGADFTARQIAQGISGSLGQPAIVENRAGPLAAEVVSKAPPDGYALAVTGSSVWLTPLLQKVSYDVLNDLSPISLINRAVLVVAVHPLLPVKSVKELIALAKARPGELNLGISVAGSPNHLAAELFKSMAGVNIVQVYYKGSGQANTALISGEVQLTFFDSGSVMPHVKSGKLKALAVTSATPSALTPGLPTVAASGLPGYEAIAATAMFAPGKTPAAIINRLNEETVRFLNRPEVKERFLNAGVEIVASSPGQFALTMKSEMAKWGKVIKDAGIKGD